MPRKWVSYPELVRRATSPQGYDYIIYKEGDYVVAKDGRTGEEEFESTDAADVLRSVFDTQDARSIAIADSISISSTVEVNRNNIRIHGLSKNIYVKGSASPLFDIRAYGVTIENLNFYGHNKENIGIEINSFGTTIRNVEMSNFDEAISVKDHTAKITDFYIKENNVGIRTHHPAHDTFIEKGIIEANDYGVIIDGGYGVTLDKVAVQYNKTIDLYGRAADEEPVLLRIVNSWFENNLETDEKLIHLGDDNHHPITQTYIEGCWIQSLTGNGIGIYIDWGGAIVAGCHFSGLDYAVKSASYFGDVYIVGGYYKNVGTIATGPNIRTVHVYKYGFRRGVATFSGDGSTTQFKIEHNLPTAPNKAKTKVWPLSADAAGDFWIDVDDTYIYVNYKSAPPSGTDNVVLG